jgi:hypothetical protein
MWMTATCCCSADVSCCWHCPTDASTPAQQNTNNVPLLLLLLLYLHIFAQQNTNNVPINEPWIYDPVAPAGQRYRRTGAYTNIPRFYHACAVMTSYGDILLGGSTIAKGFTSYHMADFYITPYNHQDFRWAATAFRVSRCCKHVSSSSIILAGMRTAFDGSTNRWRLLHRCVHSIAASLTACRICHQRLTACRIEYFVPHYIIGPRPTLEFVPTVVEYGTTFNITLAANTTASSIASVVLLEAGTTTHSSNMATRNQLLDFTVSGTHELLVTAPANTFMVPPCELPACGIAAE